MVSEKTDRTDISVFYVPATKMADDNGLKGLANIILLGKLYKELQFCTPEALEKGLEKCIPASKAAMLELNRKAMKLGMEY